MAGVAVMRRDVRELAVLLVAGALLGLGHLVLRTDMPVIAPPREDPALCGGEAPLAEELAQGPLVSSPDAPMSVEVP